MSATVAQRRKAAQCRWWYGRDARASGLFDSRAAVGPHNLAHTPERRGRITWPDAIVPNAPSRGLDCHQPASAARTTARPSGRRG
jgi:hypothetical protein